MRKDAHLHMHHFIGYDYGPEIRISRSTGHNMQNTKTIFFYKKKNSLVIFGKKTHKTLKVNSLSQFI